MQDLAIVGAIWGLGLWALWFGYFLVYLPSWIKTWVLNKKWRIIALDIIITFLGNRIINQASGTVTAGIGTFVLMFACFGSSSLLMVYMWTKKKCINMFTSKPVYH
jgi:hypothetical protein